MNSIQFREIDSDPEYWGVDDNGKPDHEKDLTLAGEGRSLKVRLPSGRHTFTVMLQGPIEFQGLEFVRGAPRAAMDGTGEN